MTPICVPVDLWDDESRGVVANWLFESGDIVAQGTVVAEIMNEKTSFEILAPCAGRLTIELVEESEITLGARIGCVDRA